MNINIFEGMYRSFTLTILSLFVTFYGLGQCSLLSTSISVDFEADGVCAPVGVNTFDVTYTFNVSQNPADITIRFIWNDPGNTVEDVTTATGLIVTNSDRTYQAISSFNYPADGNDCFYEAQAFIIVGGDVCENSEQTQIVPSWNTDNENGGNLAFTPNVYEFCEGTEIDAIIFDDGSQFNCVGGGIDNPNNLDRHVQFVYGTNTGLADAGRIKNLSLEDGGAVQLTNGLGAYDGGTTNVNGVAGAYFGPIENIPYEVVGPNSTTFALSAPEDVNNVAGNTFEITMFNWNICNPYNGDPLNPNYADAISQTALISFIAPPIPSYIAREGGPGGAILSEFCINEDIYFENQTTGGGGFDYTWQFYDGPTDADPLGTSTANNPTFSFENGGEKLIRLIATDGDANGNCDVVFDNTIILSPDAVADFDFYDETFTNIINPVYCITDTTADGYIRLGFRDNTTDVANTEYRYEFYDEADVQIATEPADGSFLADPVPDFTIDFTDIGYVRVRLVAQNTATSCASFDQDTVFIYDTPNVFFEMDTVCEGEETNFINISGPNDIPTIVNDDQIVSYEWDFSYDETLGFDPEPAIGNNTSFTRLMNDEDIVALRTTTEKGICSSVIYVDTVAINPAPDVALAYDFTTDICPGDLIDFTNNSINDAALGVTYSLAIIYPDPNNNDTIAFATTDTLLSFENTTSTIINYEAALIATTTNGCEITGSPLAFGVLPDEESQFTDPNYDPFESTCSPWSSAFEVAEATLNLSPDAITWTVTEDGVLLDGYPVTLTDPTDFAEFPYEIANTTNSTRDLEIVLEASSGSVCISNDTINIRVFPQPTAAFSLASLDEDCEQMVFGWEAEAGFSVYDWVFSVTPDEVVPTADDHQQIISYLRTDSDFDLNVSLTTTNLTNCISTTADTTVTILARKPEITASFALSSDTIQLPDATVLIENTGTQDESLSYEWDFGGQGSSTEAQPNSFSFTSFGTFLIELDIADDFCEASTSQLIVVLPADPVIDFEADTLQGCAPLTIQFTNLSENALEGEFFWELGDGSISNLDNPQHTYFSGGNYSVRLVGTNEVGVTTETTKTDYIEVYDVPFANYLLSSTIVYIPDEVYFRNLSTDATSYFWDFGDGNTSTDTEPINSYTDEGFYDILLVATNELGCSDSLFREADIEAVIGGDTNSPNAFTPNATGPNGGADDGSLNVNSVNDIFLPRLEGVVRFKMFIYNKWGQLLFKSEDQNVGWDGYFNGKLSPAGVYVYKLELRYSDGRDEIKAGDVTLIR